MKAIIDYLLSFLSPQKPERPSDATLLAEALLKDVRALEAGGKDPALKKGVLQKAKKIAGLIGGTEMIIPGYAVTVSGFIFLWIWKRIPHPCV